MKSWPLNLLQEKKKKPWILGYNTGCPRSLMTLEIYQNPDKVFRQISRYSEVRQQCSAARRIFNFLLGIWKFDERNAMKLCVSSRFTFSKCNIKKYLLEKSLNSFLRSSFPLGVIWAISASSTSDLLYLRRSQLYCAGSIVFQQSTKNNPFDIPEIANIKKNWSPNRTTHSCNSVDYYTFCKFPLQYNILHKEIHHKKAERIIARRALNTVEALITRDTSGTRKRWP